MSTTSPIPDHELAARASTGDGAAFARLARRHGDVAWALALRATCSDPVAAEQVVERAWATAWQELPARDPEGSVRLWLLGLVVRSCRGAAEPVGHAQAPVARHRGADPQGLLLGALDSLLLEPRLAWLLVEVHGLDLPSAAAVLDVPLLELEGRLLVARNALKQGLGRGLGTRPEPG